VTSFVRRWSLVGLLPLFHAALAGAVDTRLYYEDRSDGHDYVVAFARPFLALASRLGADIAFEDFGGRVFQFTGGQAVASDTVQRRFALARFHAATVGPSIEWSRARYVVTRGFEHLGQREDVDLSTRVRFDLLAAPRGFGYAHDGIGPSASIRVGMQVPGGFGFIEGRAGGVYSPAGLDSGTALVAATASVKPGSDRQRLLLHAEQSWSTGAPIGSEFDLGFRSGLRAFQSHAFTGDRAWFATAEYRYALFPELAKLAAVGIAAFAERGGAWFAGAPARNGTDVGIGLRIGPTRQADLRTVRIDLARRFANDVEPAGWVVVVGKGFTFRTAL
jgi:hypothetical protein